MSQCFVNVLQKDKKFNELKKLIEDKNAASKKKVDLQAQRLNLHRTQSLEGKFFGLNTLFTDKLSGTFTEVIELYEYYIKQDIAAE